MTAAPATATAGTRSRRALLRWLGWFTAINAGLAALIGIRYLLYYDFPADALGIGYALLAYVGQFALLSLLAVFLPWVVVVAAWPAPQLVRTLASLGGALLLSFLLVDTQVFAEHRYHVDLLTAALFEPATWVLAGIQFAIALLFQAVLAGNLARWLAKHPGRRGGRWVAAALAGCWVLGQGIHIGADALAHVPVTQFSRYLPVYFPIHAQRRLARWGLVDPEVVRERRRLRGAAAGAGQLRYPLQPFPCPQTPAPNILLVLVDALRPELLGAGLLPNLDRLAAESQIFENHWSGGNSSRMGIFSMFYGLPGTYWQAFDGVQQTPVLMDELRRRGYALLTASAVGFGSPAMIARTALAGVPGLPDEGPGDGLQKNLAVTADWGAWQSSGAVRAPFFAFLYYDPPMGSMAADSQEPLPLDGRYPANSEAGRLWRQYRLAARFVDAEIGKVLDGLRSSGMLDTTIVIVTSDHGYEFDDNGLGYLGHASAFTPAQLRTPLVIRWPGREPARYTHRSSHFDLAPTLLSAGLGCTGELADIGVGRSLFGGEDWRWLIAASYNAYAIVAPGKVIVSQAGLVEVRDEDYRPSGELDARLVSEALAVMRRFYQ